MEEGFIGVELHFLGFKASCPKSHPEIGGQLGVQPSQKEGQSPEFHIHAAAGCGSDESQLVHVWSPTRLCAVGKGSAVPLPPPAAGGPRGPECERV